MQHMQRTLATLVAGTIVASASGCYSVTVQAGNLDKPVSLSHAMGRQARPVRTFKHESVTWFVLGLVPLFTAPGSFSAGADRLTEAICRDELRSPGKGIVDLKVTTQNDVMSFALGLLPGVLGLGWLFQPISVVVEGTVVD
jgi:hypothetical protein